MDGRLVFSRTWNLEKQWPFVPRRLQEQLETMGEVDVVQLDRDDPLGEATELKDVVAIALFGGQLTEDCLRGASKLKVVGGVLDNWGHKSLPVQSMFCRNIPIVDATRAWATSVAECSLGLALCALRRLPQWHIRMAEGEPLWDFKYQQFCDSSDFVNGTLGSKRVGVMGLGQIGGRIAQWCKGLGAEVIGYDPFIPKERFAYLGVEPMEMDRLVEIVEVLFVAIPPTPSAKEILSRERISRLRKGTLVIVTTRAHAVDMLALRERIINDELAGAFDVYDKEPLDVKDPLRGRQNVVHTPHIAGRTRDANILVSNLIADDFRRVFRGEAPVAALSKEAISVRAERTDLPKIE